MENDFKEHLYKFVGKREIRPGIHEHESVW